MREFRLVGWWLSAVLLFFVISPVLANGDEYLSRELVVDDIWHYVYEDRVGGGPDIVRVHRVVRETAPERPIDTNHSVLLVSGDAIGFEGAYLGNPVATSFAVFLAQNDVDVWGIDFEWIVVPADTPDLGFMLGWDLDWHVQSLETGLALARDVRRGRGKMHLLGYSRGGWVAYAYLNKETQEPCSKRYVKGFIPLDTFYKSDIQESREWGCQSAAAASAAISAGVFADSSGLVFSAVGHAAIADPDAPSQIFPGFTNLQAALFLGTLTFNLLDYDGDGVPTPFAPFYHLVTGEFLEIPNPEDPENPLLLPVDLVNTEIPKCRAPDMG